MTMTAGVPPLIWIDYAILAFIVISALMGLLKGLIRETFSLLTWIAAIWVGLRYDSALAFRLQPGMEDQSLAQVLAFALLFSSTWVIGKISGYLVGTLIDPATLKPFNRLGGLLFGGARGVLLMVLLVLFARSSQLASEPWWRESVLLPWLEDWAMVSASLTPDDYLKMVQQP